MRFDIALIAGLAVALVACPGTLDEAKFTSATCTDPVKDIFQSSAPYSCAQSGCHSTADSPSSGELDLEAPNVAERLRGKKASGGAGFVIDTTNPENSVLITKLRKPVPFGSRMPLGQSELSAAQQKCIHDWVIANAGGSPPDGGGAETPDDASSEAAVDSSMDEAGDDATSD
jgi:hypothetical protein